MFQYFFSDGILQKFWDLENVGITHSVTNTIYQGLSEFENTVSFVKDGYKVCLAWKPNLQYQLQDNELFARKRL